MISADFAPNERWGDAGTAIKIMLRPWQWRKGQVVFKLKHRVKKMFGGRETFFFLTARAGLYRLLQALQLDSPSEILVTGFTCEAVVLPIKALRLKAVFVDIEPQTYSMDLENLQKKITEKSKVVILQHTFGLTPEYRDEIYSLARKHRLFVVEDLAHGFTTSLFQSTPPLSQSALLLSFGRSKGYSSVYGGAVLTKNARVATELKNMEKTLSYPSMLFIFQCLLYKPLSLIIKVTYGVLLGKLIHRLVHILQIIPKEVTAKEKRGNFDNTLLKAYPNALAYLLRHQFNKFDQIKQKRLDTARFFNKYFSSIKLSASTVPSRFPLLVENREEMLKKCGKAQVFLGTWYDQVIGPKEVDVFKLGYKKGSCPNAEKITEKVINLPTLISKKEAQKIINLITNHASTAR